MYTDPELLTAVITSKVRHFYGHFSCCCCCCWGRFYLTHHCHIHICFPRLVASHSFLCLHPDTFVGFPFRWTTKFPSFFMGRFALLLQQKQRRHLLLSPRSVLMAPWWWWWLLVAVAVVVVMVAVTANYYAQWNPAGFRVEQSFISLSFSVFWLVYIFFSLFLLPLKEVISAPSWEKIEGQIQIAFWTAFSELEWNFLLHAHTLCFP